MTTTLGLLPLGEREIGRVALTAVDETARQSPAMLQEQLLRDALGEEVRVAAHR